MFCLKLFLIILKCAYVFLVALNIFEDACIVLDRFGFWLTLGMSGLADDHNPFKYWVDRVYSDLPCHYITFICHLPKAYVFLPSLYHDIGQCQRQVLCHLVIVLLQYQFPHVD